MAIILFLSIVALAHFSSISAASEKVCRTPICVDYANKLRNDMNMNINPCTNFYEYVCGNWNKNHPVPIYRTSQSQLFLTSDRTKNHLREMLKPGGIGGENDFVKKAKEVYEGCMDISTIEEHGIGEIMNYIQQTGGWPIIMNSSEWKKSRKPWQTVDSEYNVIMGTSPFFKFTVEPLRKTDLNYLVVRPPFSPGDPSSNVRTTENDDDLFEDPKVIQDINLIKNIAGVMARKGGFVLNEIQVEKDAQGIIRFWDYLNDIAEFDGSGKSIITTIKKFQTSSESSLSMPSTRKIDWLQRIRKLFVRKSSVRINSSKKIMVYHEDYFKGLFLILNDLSERDIVNTIQWWFVKQALTYTNPKMLGIHNSIPRWMKCIKENELQHLLAYVQVKKNDLEKIKARVVDIVEEVKIEMKKGISQSKWLDGHSKNVANEKVDSMGTLVGYPDWYKDPTMLGNKIYKYLLKGSSYLENVLLVKQFELQQKLELLGKPSDMWSVVPSIIDANAYYYSDINSLVLPIGILQNPLFDADYPDAINYGGIGTVISHEMSHAFDSEGIHFDKHGDIGVWWSIEAISKYNQRCQSFINLFNNYGVPGKRTLDENIADSISVRTAFEVYKEHIERPFHRNEKLPGLKSLSPDKLFFVSFAWHHCQNIKPEFVGIHLKEGVHSPAPERVFGALSNSEDFSKTFKCKKNSPMNPSVKCTIW